MCVCMGGRGGEVKLYFMWFPGGRGGGLLHLILLGGGGGGGHPKF